MASATLQVIQDKVRRLTRSPSLNQLSNDLLNDYINTFILYDFPEQLRLFNLRTTFTFYTQPNVDTYANNVTNPLDPLFNFKNLYVAMHQPVFLAGIQGFYTQWRDVFYGYYPQTNTIAQTGLFGDGTTGVFTGNVAATPMLQNNVLFTCLDTSGAGQVIIDYPFNNQIGALGAPNQPQTIPSPYGQINYITGAFTLSFPANTQVGAPIFVENIAYQPGKPLAVLYYNDTFTIRPVPDNVYAIQLEADIRPTQLIMNTDVPQLEQWWQYIAYGAAKKILEDRMDLESVGLILPEFKQQERFVLRTTLTQQANERTVTIYTQGKNYGFGWGFPAGGWPY